MISDTTCVSVLTPPGTAAIATIALVGPRAWTVARDLFRPLGSAPLPDPPPLDRFWNGTFGGPTGDTVVLAVTALEPVPRVEIHCHGGQAVINWLTRVLVDHGLEACSGADAWQRFGVSAPRTLAAVELTRAVTKRTTAILLDQW